MWSRSVHVRLESVHLLGWGSLSRGVRQAAHRGGWDSGVVKVSHNFYYSVSKSVVCMLFNHADFLTDPRPDRTRISEGIGPCAFCLRLVPKWIVGHPPGLHCPACHFDRNSHFQSHDVRNPVALPDEDSSALPCLIMTWASQTLGWEEQR